MIKALTEEQWSAVKKYEKNKRRMAEMRLFSQRVPTRRGLD